jgi:hypothetical protein
MEWWVVEKKAANLELPEFFSYGIKIYPQKTTLITLTTN